MLEQFSEEQIINISFELLSTLITPFSKNSGEDAELINDFDKALYYNLTSVTNSEKYKNVIKNVKNKLQWQCCYRNQCRMEFICTGLQLMKIIKETLHETQNDKVKLLSISQRKILESFFQFIVPLGLLYYLLPGIGIGLEIKCKNVKKITNENLKEFTKYKRLCFLIDVILDLNEVDVFHDLIITKHFEDLLAVLFQLSFAPLKKPVSGNDENGDHIDFELLGDNFEITEMTYTMWNKLQQNKKKYQARLLTLRKTVYKPYIIRKLLILLSSKNMPRWMKKNLTNMLKSIIVEENGLMAMIKAVIEVENYSSMQWSHCMTVAKIISATCCDCCNDRMIKLLAPQLLEILKNERKQTYDYTSIQVAALTVNSMFSGHPQITENYILTEILKHLKMIEFSSEENINTSVNQLYNLCIVPSNNSITVPIRIILPVSRILFFIHCQIKDSIWYLKSFLKELIMKLLRESDNDLLSLLFDSFVFNEESEQILAMPNQKKCEITSSGGILLVYSEHNLSELEFGVSFLDLIKNIPESECLVNLLFICMLKKFVNKNDGIKFAEKRVVIIILLRKLAEDAVTLKQILKNSENIIIFVDELLRIHCTEETMDKDIVRICLMFLSMVLYDTRKRKNVNWDMFTSSLQIMKKYKKSEDADIKLLAEEVYNLIMMRGISSVNENFSNTLLIEEVPIQSDCEKNIGAACDPLLPVRAHALMELILLIRKSDPETLAKKEKILCLFQENLKDEDSFLYLRAIEGIACMATLEPNIVLPLLCQEFNLNSTSKIQLKIGEILMRTVKFLNDFAFAYKELLINTFLNGTKNEDALVRASSLSNLAELCRLLKCRVEDMLYEILHCVQNVVLWDEQAEPRRAAIFLISSLFQGLSTSMFKVLELRLTELYRNLKRVQSTDEDDVVRLHAQLSLDILNEKTKKFLISKPVLEKEIRILHPL